MFGAINPLDHKQIWNKIAVFITNAKRREKLKSDSSIAPRGDQQIIYNNNKTNEVDYCELANNKIINKLDRISVKSNTLSISSQYSKHSGINKLSTTINEFIEEANKFNENITATRTLNSQTVQDNSNDQMYDNLKNGTTHLTDIFKSNKDVAENLLNASSGVVTADISYNGIMMEDKNNRNSKKRTLDFIPCFAIANFDKHDLYELKRYLKDAFKDESNHPFGMLNSKVSYCFYTSYGCWKVKPTSILSSQAMQEWECITKRIYGIVRMLFPALPVEADNIDG